MKSITVNEEMLKGIVKDWAKNSFNSDIIEINFKNSSKEVVSVINIKEEKENSRTFGFHN